MKRGYTYEVHITVSEEYFDTRTYEDEVTLPAGRYRAVRVIIGSGRGITGVRDVSADVPSGRAGRRRS